MKNDFDCSNALNINWKQNFFCCSYILCSCLRIKQNWFGQLFMIVFFFFCSWKSNKFQVRCFKIPKTKKKLKQKQNQQNDQFYFYILLVLLSFLDSSLLCSFSSLISMFGLQIWNKLSLYTVFFRFFSL